MAGTAAYELIAPIGRGESSEVFRARDRNGQIVAVKLIGGREAERPESLGHIAAEVALCRRLDHSGLVRLIDCGRLDGHLYLAMELIDGPTLTSLMAARRLALPQTLSIAASVAATLAKVHAAGAVHRDVKPNNIMLRGDTEPVLMDLGVAALTPSDRAPGQDLVGSPAYLAPEVIADQPVDGKADVFALGVVLYMLTTGRRPFGGTPDEAMRRIRSDEPAPPSAIDPSLPAPLDALIMRMLAKRPEARPSASAVAEAIAAIAL